MPSIQFNPAKTLFEDGVLTKVTITKSPFGNDWMIVFSTSTNKPIDLCKQRGGYATYKTLDACYSVCRSIGFRCVKIEGGNYVC